LRDLMGVSQETKTSLQEASVGPVFNPYWAGMPQKEGRRPTVKTQATFPPFY